MVDYPLGERTYKELFSGHIYCGETTIRSAFDLSAFVQHFFPNISSVVVAYFVLK